MDQAADARADRPSGGPRIVWLSSFLAFFLLAAAWAVITPYDGAYDEHDHIVRAAGVVRGQVVVQPSDARNGRYQDVPRSLVPPNFACLRTPKGPADCQGEAPDDRSRTRVMTRAGHYNPIWYAVVGWPLAPFPTMTGVILARLVNALLCAALLAAALVTVWPRRRHRFLLLAVLLSATPMVISLNGLLNPSGMEISAAVLLWATLTGLARGDTGGSRGDTGDTGDTGEPGAPGTDEPGPAKTDEPGPAKTGRLVLLAGLAATTLALVRPAGLVVLGAIAVLTWAAIGDRGRLRDLAARRDVRVAALVTVLAAALVLVWTVAAQVGSVGTEAPADQRSMTTIVRGIVLGRFDYWVRQVVGIFGYATVVLPGWQVVAFGAVEGVLVVTGFALARRRHAYTIVAIPVACLLGGLVVEVLTARLIGAFVQGRYFLPLWVGMFVLAALAIPTRALPPTLLRRVYGIFMVVWSVAMVSGLYLTLRFFRRGPDLAGDSPVRWHPMLGEAVPFIAAAVGIGLVGWLVHRYLREPEPEPTPAADSG